jgi:outer membrane immunogenic protein
MSKVAPRAKRAGALVGVVGAVLACLSVHAVHAADLGGAPRQSIKDEPLPYAPQFSWTGLYIGAHVGYGWSDVDWQFDATPGVGTGHTGQGGLLGGQIGYNVQVKQFVFGIEADATNSWMDGSTACPNAAFNCGHSFNWLASVRGRAGLAINGNRTLLYATAGGAWADVDYAATDAVTGAKFGTGFNDRHFGWVAGAGVEHMLTSNLSARVEYLYYGFDSVTAPAGALGAGPAALDLSTQTVRFGLNLKF